ncbi:MAG: geranylgeranyl reductase family protein [Acidobacteriaceae bacterium]
MSDLFDVAIVGAGPAGSTAALKLGKAGVRVLLLEKAKSFPREKPCGGGITARALKRLPHLRDILDEISTNALSKMYLESPDGTGMEYVDPAGEPILYLVRRIDLDAALFRRAAAAITEVAMGATVTTLVTDTEGVNIGCSDGRDFRARVLIGADSANSVVARLSGLRTGEVHGQYAVDMMEETPYTHLDTRHRDRVTLLLSLPASYGYGYIFPKETHINLGFGSGPEYFVENVRGRAREHHLDFVEQMKSRGFASGESRPENYRAFPIPISGPMEKTYTSRILLAGDAAGMVNAFSAEGIYFAMVSGDLAAEGALAALQANRFDERQMSRYQAAWEREIGGELRHSVSIQKRLFTQPGRVDSLMRRAKADPELLRLLCGYAMGFATYEDLRRHMARVVMPQWVWGKVRSFVGA